MNWMLPRIVLSVLAASTVFAGEFAVLATGFRLRVDRHETLGGVVRLHTEGGAIEIAAREIQGFEPDDAPPRPPAAAVAAPSAALPPGNPARSPEELVDEAADRYGLPREFVRSVAKAESAFHPQAVSPKGAIGIMQLMPATAARLGADPRDARENVDAGVRHLLALLRKYGGSARLALAAYNAGEGAVQLHQDVPPYRETRLYVDRILREYLRPAPPPKKK